MTEQQSGSLSKKGMSRHTMDLSHTLNCDYLIVTLHNSFPGLNAIMFVMGHFMDTCSGFPTPFDMLPVEIAFLGEMHYLNLSRSPYLTPKRTTRTFLSVASTYHGTCFKSSFIFSLVVVIGFVYRLQTLDHATACMVKFYSS